MENGPVVGAHFIFPAKEDIEIIKRHGGHTVHCPDATTNIIAGIMGVSALHSDGVNITLGTDVGGGHSMGIYTQIGRAVQLSKLKWFYEPENASPITFTNAFYLATKAGGQVFGKVGSFEKDYVLLAPGDHDHILSGVFNQFLSANPRASRINKKSANNPALID